MLDLKFINDNQERVSEMMENRGLKADLVAEFVELDEKRRDILYEVEQLRHRRNVASDKIGQLKRAG